ncbi:hypothetical protein ACRS6B_20215 [Nocardia asteroides]
MAPGEDSGEAGDNASSGSAGGETPDAPPHARGRADPSVETVWLRRSPAPDRPGWPRISTVALLVAFIAIFALYLVLNRGAS